MAERDTANGDLASILQDLRLQRPGPLSSAEATEAQLDLLLTRGAALTKALNAEPSTPGGATQRLLRADLAMVAWQFRGHVTSIGGRLHRVLDDIDALLKGFPNTPSTTPESQ